MSVALSFNYNRVPAAQDKFSKMILTPETDMVLEVENPKINSNSMVWDMSSNGTKNYSFRINGRNTEKINSEWQIAESQWNAVLNIHLSAQGTNHIHPIPNGTPEYLLGEIKVSFRIKYIQTDSPHDNLNRITHTDLLNLIRVKFSSEILLMKMVEEKKKLKKEKEKFDQKIKLLNEGITKNVISDSPSLHIQDDVE
jgi:hypothetical protein